MTGQISWPMWRDDEGGLHLMSSLEGAAASSSLWIATLVSGTIVLDMSTRPFDRALLTLVHAYLECPHCGRIPKPDATLLVIPRSDSQAVRQQHAQKIVDAIQRQTPG